MPNNPACVLYIDDDPAFARLVQRVLGRQGYAVENVASGDDALTRLAQGGIDVIALDHFLLSGTGLDILASLRALPKRPPVVYVTATTEVGVAVAALKAGASDYVLKTVGDEFFELLKSAINQAIDKARLQLERDRAEKEVREARDRAEVLLHEVNHRVANSLALVAAFVAMQARSVSDHSVRSALGEIKNKIAAIAGVHRHLYSSKDVRVVEICNYLTTLVRDLEATFQQAGHASTVRLTAERVEVSTDKAVSIGIVVTELVTNAFKYAYPTHQAGEIRVRLQKCDPDKITLSVEDDGVGWTGKGTIKGTGAGSGIVNDLAKGLGAEVIYNAEAKGCRAVLEFEI
jgi:two-component sensor histidine kinase/CheY-like chemotaxis protein